MKELAEGIANQAFQPMRKLKGCCQLAQKRVFLREKSGFIWFLSQFFSVHNLIVPCCFSVQGRFPWYLKRVVLLLAGWGLTAGPASGVCQRCVFENVGSRWAVLPPLNQQRANSVPALPEGRVSLWILCGSGWASLAQAGPG
jgi:hypothetical protein